MIHWYQGQDANVVSSIPHLAENVFGHIYAKKIDILIKFKLYTLVDLVLKSHFRS